MIPVDPKERFVLICGQVKKCSPYSGLVVTAGLVVGCVIQLGLLDTILTSHMA